MPRFLRPSLTQERCGPVAEQRSARRLSLRLPGRLTWQDAEGKPRTVRVRTRNVSEHGAFVECVSGTDVISLYRLVDLHLDDAVRTRSDVPSTLKQGRVSAAIYRVGNLEAGTGRPEGYALRLLVKPDRRRRKASSASLTVASR